MKKVLVSLIVLALVAPAMADVDVTATSPSNGVLEITVTPSGGAVVRGVSLLLGTNSGDGQATSASVTGLNTNIDYYATNGIVDTTPQDNVPDDAGHPAADPTGPGVATLPSADLALCSGYLDAGGSQGGLPGTAVFTVNYTGSSATEVSIALDTLNRGGIVGDDLGTVTVQGTQTVNFGGPACWAYACHAYGDSDGDGDTDVDDIYVLLGGWSDYNGTTTVTAGTIDNLCADTDNDGDVDVDDIYNLLDGWNGLCPG